MKRNNGVKRFTAWVLATVLMLTCVVPTNVAFAEGQESAKPSSVQVVNQGGANVDSNGSVTNEDGVKVSKTIEGTDKENYFDITLEVETKQSREELLKSETTDVVIVLDISNTMNSKATNAINNATRLDNAKKAAKEFVTSYAKGIGENGKVSVVTFNRDAKVLYPLTTATSSNVTKINSKISDITAPSGYDVRWTNYRRWITVSQ